MKGNLITRPGITAHSDHAKPIVIYIKWFREIPREDVQQMIGAHHNFHIVCMESHESYRMTWKNAHQKCRG